MFSKATEHREKVVIALRTLASVRHTRFECVNIINVLSNSAVIMTKKYRIIYQSLQSAIVVLYAEFFNDLVG